MFTTRKKGCSSRSFMFFRYCGLIISLLQLGSVTADGEMQGNTPRREVGPYCDPNTNTIFFADEYPSKIRSYITEAHTDYGANIVNITDNEPYTMSFAIPIKGNSSLFVAGLGAYLGVIEWDGKSDKTINPIFTKEMTNSNLKIKTGTTDTKGNLFIVLPGINVTDSTLVPVDSTGLPKGALSFPGLGHHIAFGSDKFYYTDVAARVIIGKDYNSKDVEFSNSHVVFNMSALSLTGTPGGLAVDQKGNLWISCNSDPIVGFEPIGATAFAKLPASTDNKLKVTTVVFCGSNMEQMFALTDTDQPESTPPVVDVKNSNGQIFMGVGGAPAKYARNPPA